jgi:hypothetical protein
VGIVSRPSSKIANQPKKKDRVMTKAEPEDFALDSQDLYEMSEEDDSLEKELAMSSPMKGSELRSTTKVSLLLYYCQQPYLLVTSLL